MATLTERRVQARRTRAPRIILSQLPILIGQGIPLFGPLKREVRLRLFFSRTFPGGMVQSEYEVLA